MSTLTSVCSHDFSLPLEVACVVAKWGREHGVHCVTGRAFPNCCLCTTIALPIRKLNVSISVGSEADGAPTSDIVVDALLRHDRAGRASLSQLESPNAKRELILQEPETLQLLTSDGWVTAVLLPSRDAAQQYLEHDPADRKWQSFQVVSMQMRYATFSPRILYSRDRARCGVLTQSALRSCNCCRGERTHSIRQSDAWEGASFFTIEYDRLAVSGWSVSICEGDRVPLVYSMEERGLAFRGKRFRIWVAPMHAETMHWQDYSRIKSQQLSKSMQRTQRPSSTAEALKRGMQYVTV